MTEEEITRHIEAIVQTGIAYFKECSEHPPMLAVITDDPPTITPISLVEFFQSHAGKVAVMETIRDMCKTLTNIVGVVLICEAYYKAVNLTDKEGIQRVKQNGLHHEEERSEGLVFTIETKLKQFTRAYEIVRTSAGAHLGERVIDDMPCQGRFSDLISSKTSVN